MVKSDFEKTLIKLFEQDVTDDIIDGIKLDDENIPPRAPKDEVVDAVEGETPEGDSEFEESKEENEKINQALKKQRAEVKSLIYTWIDTIEDFIKFINDPQDPNSMRSILDKNKDNETSPLSKIASAGRIANVAGQLSSFVEQLRGCVNQGVSSTVDM